jgi:hypothetical protein
MRRVSAGACLQLPSSVATCAHVSYYDCSVEIHRSARKHGIDDAAPARELRLGFATHG